MWGPALVLAFFLLLEGQQGQDSAEHVVVGLSGKELSLQPATIQTNHINSVKWKMKRSSTSETSVILTWKNGSGESEKWTKNNFTKTFDFKGKNLTLLIKAPQQADSGDYLLEVTDDSGKVKNYQFKVFVFDHVGTLQIVEERKVLDGGKCHVSLSCSVPKGDNVTYVWYRGDTVIQTSSNLSKLEEQIDVNVLERYTCNVSNPVSSVARTFSQRCQSVNKRHTFVFYLVLIVISLVALFLVVLTCFCVWRRKRKQTDREPADQTLTVYEDLNNLQNRCNQEQRPRPPAEGNTIYSMIQSQTSAPPSQETNTLYALVQPTRKSESKKKNQSSPLNYTIYEEVGKTQLKAQNPARLSRKELENFCVYS